MNSPSQQEQMQKKRISIIIGVCIAAVIIVLTISLGSCIINMTYNSRGHGVYVVGQNMDAGLWSFDMTEDYSEIWVYENTQDDGFRRYTIEDDESDYIPHNGKVEIMLRDGNEVKIEHASATKIQ